MSLLLESHASQDLYPRLSSLDPGTPTIRLIDILPGDFAAPIHCQLVEHKLRQTLSYKALSYSWKTDEGLPDVIIFCNAKPIYISANLHAALQRLRSPHDQVTLWVDAICINQQDDDERAYQVGMMRDIYKNSSEVLIWLGGGGAYDDTGGCVSIGGEGRGSGVAVLQNNTHDEANIVQWFGDERDIPKLKAYFSPSSEEARRSSYSEKTRDIFGAFCVLHLLASGVPVDKIWHLRHVHYSMGIVNGLNEILDKPWVSTSLPRMDCLGG
jgi:hypothetical protein